MDPRCIHLNVLLKRGRSWLDTVKLSFFQTRKTLSSPAQIMVRNIMQFCKMMLVIHMHVLIVLSWFILQANPLVIWVCTRRKAASARLCDQAWRHVRAQPACAHVVYNARGIIYAMPEAFYRSLSRHWWILGALRAPLVQNCICHYTEGLWGKRATYIFHFLKPQCVWYHI